MTIANYILLFALKDLMRLDIMVWLGAIPVVIAGILVLLYQFRQHKLLKAELKQLSAISRHAVEYDMVMKAMKVGVWRIDVPSLTITYESDFRESSDIHMIPSGSDVEMFCGNLLPEEKKKVSAAMKDLLEGRIEEFHEQYEMRTQNGETGWGESFAVVEKRNLEGKPVVIVGTSMRIDKQKAIEQALIDARNQAEESDRLKSAFLANMSHEIRTPLNAIVGFSDVLPMAQTEEERIELIDLIKKNNAHLLRLFDDMVNMSRLEAGGATLQKTRFELPILLDDMADQYAERAEEKGLRIEVESLDDIPTIYTDRERLAEIINKYMDNAMKFTEKGSVKLGFSVDGGKVRVFVQDTGKGIPEDRCNEQLFERFVKVDDFVPGTGLGLSICRSLALCLGGTVGVESTLGKGSQFWVEIPLE